MDEILPWGLLDVAWHLYSQLKSWELPEWQQQSWMAATVLTVRCLPDLSFLLEIEFSSVTRWMTLRMVFRWGGFLWNFSLHFLFIFLTGDVRCRRRKAFWSVVRSGTSAALLGLSTLWPNSSCRRNIENRNMYLERETEELTKVCCLGDTDPWLLLLISLISLFSLLLAYVWSDNIVLPPDSGVLHSLVCSDLMYLQ